MIFLWNITGLIAAWVAILAVAVAVYGLYKDYKDI